MNQQEKENKPKFETKLLEKIQKVVHVLVESRIHILALIMLSMHLFLISPINNIKIQEPLVQDSQGNAILYFDSTVTCIYFDMTMQGRQVYRLNWLKQIKFLDDKTMGRPMATVQYFGLFAGLKHYDNEEELSKLKRMKTVVRGDFNRIKFKENPNS